jgi:hypothetical protein
MSASWFDPSSWSSGGDGSSVTVNDPGTSWGDTTPVAPTDTSSSTSSGVYPDPGSPTCYSDINGTQVDSTGQPVQYDSSGQLIDSNGNVIQKAGTYEPSSADSTTTTDANGNTVTTNSDGSTTTTNANGSTTTKDANGNVISNTPASSSGKSSGGLLSNLLGGSSSSNGSSDSSSGLLGTLGMLAAGAGAGYLLSNLLSNKSSTGTATVAPAQAATIAPGNLQFNKLASPAPITVNPISAQTPGPMPTNLGQLIIPTNIQTINPQTLMPVAPQGH